MELPSRYSYNPRWTIILACSAFFGACSGLMVYEAVHNDRGLIVEGIKLGPVGATVFYWVIAALAGLFVLSGLLLTIRRLANPQVLELGVDAFLLPHGFLQRLTTRIRYSDIQLVTEVEVSGHTYLNVIANGQKFTIAASLFAAMDSYTEVRDFLRSQAVH